MLAISRAPRVPVSSSSSSSSVVTHSPCRAHTRARHFVPRVCIYIHPLFALSATRCFFPPADAAKLVSVYFSESQAARLLLGSFHCLFFLGLFHYPRPSGCRGDDSSDVSRLDIVNNCSICRLLCTRRLFVLPLDRTSISYIELRCSKKLIKSYIYTCEYTTHYLSYIHKKLQI